MPKDPICGMTGLLERHGQWFCSERCARVYVNRQNSNAASTSHPQGWRRLCDPWIWVPLTGVCFALLDTLWPSAKDVSTLYRHYLAKVMAPFLIGLVFAGALDHFIPKEYIGKLLAGSQKRVILRATLLGFLASTCSHGCLALAIELYRKGASVPAVISFLLASPWANMALTLIILSFFGLYGFLIIMGALLSAWIIGLIFQRLAKKGWIESNPHTLPVDPSFSIRKDLARRFQNRRWDSREWMEDLAGIHRGMVPLGRMVLGWVQFGLILGVVLGTTVPHHVFTQYFGASISGLAMTLLAATVIEVCSEGSAPLAFELFRQTGALGNAYVFLMAGVVTDFTELAALWSNIGRKTVFWLLITALPLTVVVGWAMNSLP